MDAQRVDLFLMTNNKYFHSYQLPAIRQALLNVTDDRWPLIQMTQFKDPTIVLLFSLFFGYLAIDRFIIGDTGLGIVKLLTCGGLGFWILIDWFLIMSATRDKNFMKLQMVLF